MGQTSPHGRIIAAAAKAVLAPLGCVRRGQSRIWQDDHRYWAINVEFQPSGWQKGSYLNIHVAWLWHVSEGYQFSYRAGPFVPFETVGQFTPLMTELATIAGDEVQKVRVRFKTFSDILEHIKANNVRAGWPGFDAAIACGLAGDAVAARQYFDQVAAWDDTEGRPWRIQAQKDAADLMARLDHPRIFREAVVEYIAQRRQLMQLPSDLHCLDELDSTARP